jgi:hypothetical protein
VGPQSFLSLSGSIPRPGGVRVSGGWGRGRLGPGPKGSVLHPAGLGGPPLVTHTGGVPYPGHPLECDTPETASSQGPKQHFPALSYWIFVWIFPAGNLGPRDPGQATSSLGVREEGGGTQSTLGALSSCMPTFGKGSLCF